jgi:hypothetical protein
MRTTKTFKRFTATATATVLAGTAFFAHVPEAHAEEVASTGKGIVGGALLGAEVVTITESLIGLKEGWMYAVGAGVGAIGGGLGGWAVESASSDGRVPMYMLAGGLGLVIPAVVLMLNATRYKASEDATEDKAPTGPAADPGKVGGTSVLGAEPTTPTTPAPGGAGGGATTPPPSSPPPTTPPPPQSLFDVHGSMFRMGLPVPDVKPVYSARELKELGVPQQTMVRMPVLNVVF